MNLENETLKPILVEPGVKYFINETLKQCNIIKEKYNNIIFNFFLLFLFIIIISIILIFKYKGKLTPEEEKEKEEEKKQYILNKLKAYKETKLREQQSLITGLPYWHNEYDSLR